MKSNQDGSITVMTLAIAFALTGLMVLVVEFCYCMTVRAHMQGIMETTLESVVEYWTMDDYRRDEELYISEEAAMDSYREMISENLNLDRDGYKIDEAGRRIWRYEEMEFRCSDNGIWIKARITVWPAILGDLLAELGTNMGIEAKAYINYNK